MNTQVHPSNAPKSAGAKPAPSSVYEEMMQSDMQLWKKAMHGIDDPVVARVLADFFEANPGLAAKRPGAVIAARVTVQRARIRYAKAFRMGQRAGAALKLLHAAARLLARAALTVGQALRAQLSAPKQIERTEPGVDALGPMNGLEVTHLDGDEGLRVWRAANDAQVAFSATA